MLTHARGLQALRFEWCLLGVAWRARGCFLSRIALGVGIGYWVVPWQLIPDRVPVFGYADNVLFVLIGFIAARLLIPPRLEHLVARQVGGGHGMTMHVAALRSDVATSWLLGRRRISRFGAHFLTTARRVRSRCGLLANARSLSGMAFVLLGYRLWWLIRGPFAARRSMSRSIVVVGGAARSGTTLLRTILGRHPMIASAPETTVFLRRISSPEDIAKRVGWDAALIEQMQRDSHSQAEFIERFQRAMLDRSGKAVWVEKTPKNAERFGFVRRHFPYAKLVHIVRDGRDVVCSLRKTPFAKLDHAPAETVAAAQRCAIQWRASVRPALRFRHDPLYHELRYEDLVRDPETVLRPLFAFLELPWDDRVLERTAPSSTRPARPIEDDFGAEKAAGTIFVSSLSRWRHDLSPDDCRALQLLIGPLLVELGYESGMAWRASSSPGPSSS